MAKTCEFRGGARCNNFNLQSAYERPEFAESLGFSKQDTPKIPYYLRKLPGWRNFECRASIDDGRNVTEIAMRADQNGCPGYQEKFIVPLELIRR